MKVLILNLIGGLRRLLMRGKRAKDLRKFAKVMGFSKSEYRKLKRMYKQHGRG